MGGIATKTLQVIGSSDSLIRSVFKTSNAEELYEIKKELNKSMDSNIGMAIEQIIKLLDLNNLEYDKSNASNIKILGTGSIASVVSVPMKDGTTKAVKIVNSKLEIKFLSDTAILKNMMYLVSFFKPKILNTGSRKAIAGYFEKIPKEFDLRQEAENTLIQNEVVKKVIGGGQFI